jgi:acetyl-CoA carboxylase biotin carboxylase subunit
MNTRIQVEHPVTEMVYGVDLVKEQILIADGEDFKHIHPAIEPKGHALECRINAEDVSKGFRPSAGKITSFHVPGGMGIRVDTHAYAMYQIPPYYDSLIAKLIAYGHDRPEVIKRMRRALDEFIIEGIPTTIPFHKQVMTNERFVRGDFNTHFLEHFEFREESIDKNR